MKYNFKKLPLILSTTLLIFSCFVFFSLYMKIKNNIIDSDSTFSEWKNEYDKREEIKLLNNFIKSTQEKRLLLDTHFAQSSNIVPFLDMFEKLGSQLGLKVEIISVNIPSDNTGLEVAVKASGRFEFIYKFIKLLEISPYEIEIASFDMRKTSSLETDSNQSSEWSVNLSLKLLSFIK